MEELLFQRALVDHKRERERVTFVREALFPDKTYLERSGFLFSFAFFYTATSFLFHYMPPQILFLPSTIMTKFFSCNFLYIAVGFTVDCEKKTRTAHTTNIVGSTASLLYFIFSFLLLMYVTLFNASFCLAE